VGGKGAGGSEGEGGRVGQMREGWFAGEGKKKRMVRVGKGGAKL